MATVARKLREENVNSEYRNLLMFEEGNALQNLGDVRGAIAAREQSASTHSLRFVLKYRSIKRFTFRESILL